MAPITAAQLNEVAALIECDDKNTAITAAIAVLVGEGVSLGEAFDAVFGEGAFFRMKCDLYDSIRSRGKIE
jgi:hypothetical protein